MIKVVVGEVEIRTDMDLTPRQLHALITKAASISVALAEASQVPDEAKPTFGFAAHIERLAEEIPQDDLSQYFEEEE
jgi:hypothetical protein